MAFRFRKSFKLAPGVRMNLSGSGMSWSVGPRGATYNVGGSKRRRSAAQTRNAPVRETTSVAISIEVDDEGTLIFTDLAGKPLPEHYIDVAKKQQGPAIRKLIESKCAELNAQIEAIGELHLDTPPPTTKPTFEPVEFPLPRPTKPTPKPHGLWSKLFKSVRAKVDLANEVALADHRDELNKWHSQKEAFKRAEEARRILIEERIFSEEAAMEAFLESSLDDIVWPRETIISAGIYSDGKQVFVDVDLPEIEDMPTKNATVPARGYKLAVKEMSPIQVQRLYMRHVHSIAFRAIGETFAALPVAQEVVISGYSQRADKKTARVGDEYLYSVRVSRSAWSESDFTNLPELDVVEALTRFDLRRSMSKNGLFKPVEPFAPS